jgi:hypothetical protein
MGEQMINSFDGLSADFIAEKRHTSRDNDSSRGGDHGGSVSDEEGSTTLSAEHVPPVKVKFRTEYTQPAAPEAPAAPGSTTTGENTTVPSEGVIDFMAPGVGELPAAQPEVTPAPAAPIETTKLDLSGENDSATAGVREAAGQQFEAGTRQIDPEFMAVAQAAARERLAATETPVQAEAPAAQPEVTPAPAAPAEGSGITLTGEGNGPTAEATGNWFAQQAKEFNQNHPDFAASLNDQPEATTQTAEAPAEAVPPIPEQPAETTPNYGEQVVARIKDEFYHPEKRSEAAQTPEAEEGAQESAVVKAAEHLADAADSLDATVAKLQDVLDNEKAEKRKGPDREHAVRSLLEVSGQGDRPIDSAFEATALEVLRDL